MNIPEKKRIQFQDCFSVDIFNQDPTTDKTPGVCVNVDGKEIGTMWKFNGVWWWYRLNSGIGQALSRNKADSKSQIKNLIERDKIKDF